MRKTFLKVALIGLLVGSLPVGFTSCKDYDDDIEQTNNQVADLKTKLASVETAIAALPSKADVTAAQAAAVAQAKADLEAVKAELQKAIDGKADKEAVEAINTELSSIKGQLETIEALKGQVSEAMDAINASIDEIKADALTKGQMIAGLEAQIAELKEAQGEGANNVAALTEELTALKTAVNDPESGIEALKKQIAALAEQINTENPGGATSLEAVLRVINGMITHIEVIGVNADAPILDKGFDSALRLYTVKTVKDLVFGQGFDKTDGSGQYGFDKATFSIQNPVTFKEGEIKSYNDSLLVRVSPTNAVVTADQIQLVNTLGDNLSKFIEITDVKPYTGLLTNAGSRSVSGNGMHKVYFKIKEDVVKDADLLKEYIKSTVLPANVNLQDIAKYEATETEEEFAKRNNYIKFAVAVQDNDKANFEGRLVTSAFNVNVIARPNPAQKYLNYKVVYKNEPTWVSSIRNRFDYAYDQNNDQSAFMFLTSSVANWKTSMAAVYAAGGVQNEYRTAKNNGFTPVGDFAWAWNSKTEEYTNVAAYAAGGSDKDLSFEYDNRTGNNLLEIKLGEPFTVDLSNYDVLRNNGIYGFYVTLDMWRATESNGSEREGWKRIAPSISGINTVTTGQSLDITIAKDADVDRGEILGFRVYAVNFDGSLVDPDGRAFYVINGKVDEVDEIDVTTTLTTPTLVNWAAPAEAIELGDWVDKYPEVQLSFTADAPANPLLNNNIKIQLMGQNNDATVLNKTITNGYSVWLTRNAGGNKAAAYSCLSNLRIEFGAAAISVPQGMTAPAPSIWAYANGIPYTGTITVIDPATNLELQKINVSITKTFDSTKMPVGFGINTAGGVNFAGTAADPIICTITDASGIYNMANTFTWGSELAMPGETGDPLGVGSLGYTDGGRAQNNVYLALQYMVQNNVVYENYVYALGLGKLDVGGTKLEKDPYLSNVKNPNLYVINNGIYPMHINYTYDEATSFEVLKGADGKAITATINGEKYPYYTLVQPTAKSTFQMAFKTIASQLTLSWFAGQRTPDGKNWVTGKEPYAPSLQRLENGTIDLTKVMASQNITTATPWKDANIGDLLTNRNLTLVPVEDAEEGTPEAAGIIVPAGLADYYDVTISGTTINFTPTSNTTVPGTNVSGVIKLNLVDYQGVVAPFELSLPSITMKK